MRRKRSPIAALSLSKASGVVSEPTCARSSASCAIETSSRRPASAAQAASRSAMALAAPLRTARSASASAAIASRGVSARIGHLARRGASRRARDQVELQPRRPHRGAEVALHRLVVRVVAARTVLREVDEPRPAEQRRPARARSPPVAFATSSSASRSTAGSPNALWGGALRIGSAISRRATSR